MIRKNIAFLTFTCFLGLLLMGFVHHDGGVYRTNNGTIEFFSHTPVEDIKAENHKVKSAFSSESGKIQFSVLIRDFEFEKALMQEHFNENYLESHKYPKATFNGFIENLAAINFNKEGTYASSVTGKLQIKDVSKNITTLATFEVKDGKVRAYTRFKVNPEEYNISIPKLVSKNISRSIEVSVDNTYSHAH